MTPETATMRTMGMMIQLVINNPLVGPLVDPLIPADPQILMMAPLTRTDNPVIIFQNGGQQRNHHDRRSHGGAEALSLRPPNSEATKTPWCSSDGSEQSPRGSTEYENICLEMNRVWYCYLRFRAPLQTYWNPLLKNAVIYVTLLMRVLT